MNTLIKNPSAAISLSPDTPYGSSNLVKLVLYHISPDAHTTSDIPSGPPTPIETFLPGQEIEVSKSSPTGPFLVQVRDQNHKVVYAER